MATQIEKVYTTNGDQVYPETLAQGVIVSSQKTLDIKLAEIDAQLSNLSGAESVAKSLELKVAYLLTNSSELTDELKQSDQWGENFQLPTVESPYVWKRTQVTYAGQAISGDTQTTYEIVTADTAEISQTLYMVKNNQSQPTIKYPQIAQENKDTGEVENVDNTNASLDDIITESNKDNENSWSKTPAEISAANPYGFIAVRTRLKGSWSKFAVALNAKWAYDSEITIKYTVTSTNQKPTVNKQSTNPGSIWIDDNSSEFTGYLWMITATKSNNNYMTDSNQNIWSNPQLISIVK